MPYPPLTQTEFEGPNPERYAGIALVETDDANWILAYGHIDPATMVAALLAYDQAAELDTAPYYTSHCWAVTVEPPDSPDGWQVQWGTPSGNFIGEHTPNAFPITLVCR